MKKICKNLKAFPPRQLIKYNNLYYHYLFKHDNIVLITFVEIMINEKNLKIFLHKINDKIFCSRFTKAA